MENNEIQAVETVIEKTPSLMTKKTIIIAGGVILVAAIGYGIYKVIRARKEKEVTVKHEEFIPEELEEEE